PEPVAPPAPVVAATPTQAMVMVFGRVAVQPLLSVTDRVSVSFSVVPGVTAGQANVVPAEAAGKDSPKEPRVASQVYASVSPSASVALAPTVTTPPGPEVCSGEATQLVSSGQLSPV